MATDAERMFTNGEHKESFYKELSVLRVISNSLTHRQLNLFGPKKDNVAGEKSCLQE